jgi:hypothetical protein
MRGWVFQGNPERYDLEGALQQLDSIRWRVPQRTGEILPGDVAVLWRSGPEAGIVGVGRVVEAPREAVMAAEERQFDRGDGDELTTRATLRVRPSEFVSKAEVAALPAMATHQIVTAPMGTVFPLDEQAWQALQPLLPTPPELPAGAALDWPPVFAWEQRTKSVTLLPGGIDGFQRVLTEILTEVDATQLARAELIEWLAEHYEVSARRAALVIGYLGRTGLLRAEPTRVELTPDGAGWLADRDRGRLLALLHGRVRYVGEMLAHLDEPRTTEQLLRHANEVYGMRWTSRGQIVRRRHLLGGLDAVVLDDAGRLQRTDFGTRVLGQLAVAAPQPSPAGPSDATDAPAPEVRVQSPAREGSPQLGDDVLPTAEQLAERLEQSAHDSTNPNAFEQAARDAFAFLGFDATWHGGAGRTDVLLTAPLGSQGQYRVVVDTKTTASDAVGDNQIDWETIDEHQARYEADYALLLAPAFRGDRVAKRARTNRAVTLLDVAALTEVLRQHEVAPLDLNAYRALFIPDQATDEVIERGDTLRRELALTAQILRQIHHLAGDEGPVTTTDLYWNLDTFAEQFEGRAERAEIQTICEVLAQPPFALIRPDGHGYSPLGSLDTVSRRLRLLATLTNEGIPETQTDQ